MLLTLLTFFIPRTKILLIDRKCHSRITVCILSVFCTSSMKHSLQVQPFYRALNTGAPLPSLFLIDNWWISVGLQDPVVTSIRTAVDRLTHSTNFLHFMGKHALILQEDLPSPSQDDVDDQGFDLMSLMLNLTNTFLYMVNTYIIVPHSR